MRNSIHNDAISSTTQYEKHWILSLDLKLDQVRSKYVYRDVVNLQRVRRDIDIKGSLQCPNEDGTIRSEAISHNRRGQLLPTSLRSADRLRKISSGGGVELFITVN